jgi:hypothetical protein
MKALPIPLIAFLFLIVAGLLSSGFQPVKADTPVAVVEDVGEDVQSVQLFDFVQAGQTIVLGDRERLVLGYLSSCRREEITGGTVTVGTSASTVAGGDVSVETVECDGGGLVLTAEQKGKSGVQVVRADEASGGAGEKRPSLTIYGASPVILAVGASGSVSIMRLDRSETTIVAPFHNNIADLAKAKGKLTPGGIYQAVVGKRSIVFRVDRYARPGNEPLLSRMVRL